MKPLVFVLTCAMLCTSAFAASSQDPVRAYADSMAQAIVAGKSDVLIENFAPILRQTYGDAKLVSPLKEIHDKYGTISNPEFRNSTVGGLIVAGRNIRTATCWYALAATKVPAGLFLQVSIARGDNRYNLASFAVTQFVGNNVPPELRAPAPQ